MVLSSLLFNGVSGRLELWLLGSPCGAFMRTFNLTRIVVISAWSVSSQDQGREARFGRFRLVDPTLFSRAPCGVAL